LSAGGSLPAGRPRTRLAAAAVLWLAAGSAVAGCGRAAPQPQAAPSAAQVAQVAQVAPRALRPAPREVLYTVAVDAALSRLDVSVCFSGPAPAKLHCTAAEGAPQLDDARLLGPVERPLPHDAHHVTLDGVPDDACVGYRVELSRLAASEVPVAAPGRGAVWLKAGEWLWRPAGSLAGVRLRARFQLPPGMSLSVPWPVSGEDHLLDPSVFAFKSYMALGALEHERVELRGGALQVAILPGLAPATRAAVRPWLEAQAQAVALGGGGFPARQVQVLLVPTPSVGQPVHFGTTLRGGGASLVLFVSEDADPEALRTDWVALHELCHLRLPFLVRRDAWLSEGLATYHQEVLRVRAGLQEPAVAWARLFQGSVLRYGADQSLAVESEQMGWKHNYPLVYWSGASFALLADVALRERSAGRQSLDSVLAELTACCAVSERPWTAQQVIERLDRAAGMPLFGELYRQQVLSPTLPELGALYGRLGLSVREGRAELAPAAELGWVREAIMTPPPPR
jgi:hypothetical protein